MPIDEYGFSVCDRLRATNHSLSIQLAKAEARAEKMAEELTKYIRCELCGWDNDPTCPRCVRRETIEEVAVYLETHEYPIAASRIRCLATKPPPE